MCEVVYEHRCLGKSTEDKFSITWTGDGGGWRLTTKNGEWAFVWFCAVCGVALKALTPQEDYGSWFRNRPITTVIYV